MAKRVDANDGLQTGRKKDAAVATKPASVASLPDIAQRLHAKELYAKREGKQSSVPTLPDIGNRLNESSTAEKVSSHMHRHRRHHH